MTTSDENTHDLLHITIGAAPSGAVSLERDLQMVKAALLYSDHAMLCSPASSLMLQMLLLGQLDKSQQLDLYEQLLPALIAERTKLEAIRNDIHNYRLLIRRKKLRPDDVRFVERFDKRMRDTWGNVQIIVERQAEQAGTEGLIIALQSGLLELHSFQISDQGKDIARQFFDVIAEAVLDQTTYPLLDDSTSGLIRASIEEGKLDISGGGFTRAKHAGLVGQLLERLPLFSEASVKDILDIRRELEKPLVRFRGAIVRFSSDIKSAAWDNDFPFDVQQVYLRDIAPAVLEIEEATKSNQALRSLLPKVLGTLAEKPASVAAGSAIGFFISQLYALPQIVTGVLGTTIPAAILIQETHKEWREKQSQIERNQLFFYYKAGKLLKSAQD